MQWSDGTPIYIHGDTGWSLPRDYKREEVIEYLDRTVEQKFNTVQMSAVFHEVEQATNRGLIVIINPIWKRQHVNTIKDNGVDKCREYGKWFAQRYRDNPLVLYFVCGDAVPEPVKVELAVMAEGIQDVYGGKAIIAVHSRQTTSSMEVYPEQPEWLTLNWSYAYCPIRADWNLYPYEHNLRNYQQFPDKPMQFCEGYYDFGKARKTGPTGVLDRWENRYAIRLWKTAQGLLILCSG